MSRLFVVVIVASACAVTRADDSFTVPKNAARVLHQRCIDCHAGESAESNVRLDNLAMLKKSDRLELLNQAQEQLYFGLMPPEDAEQPSDTEREVLADWVSGELKKFGASKLEDKLRRPDAGNYVDHDKLFSGEHAELPGFTYDRRWLISEYIFDAKFNRLLDHKPTLTIDGTRQGLVGSNNRRVNLTNPFLLPSNSGVRYYANETLNGGHLLTMLTNAKESATHMMYLAGRDSRYLPAINAVMALENKHKATLNSRHNFLNNHIERVLQDVFGAKHATLLPSFEPGKVIPKIETSADPQEKVRIGAASPGRDETAIIYRSMIRYEEKGQSDEQLIERSVREWFYAGHNERKVRARVTFMRVYLPELRKDLENPKNQKQYAPYQYKPLADAEMQAITESVRKHLKPGARFNTVIQQCMTQWEAEFKQARIDAGPPRDEVVADLVEQLFAKIIERPPTTQEAEKYFVLTQAYIQSLGREKTIEKLIQTLILNTEFVYRGEFGQGTPDVHGRRMMSPRDASYAIAYALTDSSPDSELAKATAEGRLSTRNDYEREVRRMLANRAQYYVIDESVNKQNDISNFTNMPIRELRFFREFFGYQKMLLIFKDNKRFGSNYDAAKQRLVTEADRLIEYIVENDKDVIHELLTTDKFYVYHSGDNEAMRASADRIREIYDYFKGKDWQDFTLDDLIKHKDFIGEIKMRGIDVNRLEPGGRYNPLQSFKTQMASFTLRLDKGQTAAAPYNSFPAHGMANASSRYGGRLQSPDVARFYGIDMYNWHYLPTQPAKMQHRKGILTHPAWLIAHAQNTETDPIHRGKWVQEKLLAGTIPDVPITVDAVVPENPHKTLRQRLDAKTKVDYCWTCHQKMNPLGLPFEMYDDFGRYRTEERLEYPENLIKKSADKGGPEQDLRDIYKTLTVETTGVLDGTGDSKLDGEVKDALDLIDRLAKSDRVRQSIIRHAFRYFMGRNEILSDSKTLIDADKAYLESGGSFDAVIVSLLTSDSFIYRKPVKD